MSEQSDSDEGPMSSINWWLDFFADAGVPPTSAAEYAVSFAEQRIPQEYEIILELGTEEWRELGVTVLGDRLAMKNLAKTGGKPKTTQKKIKKPKKVTQEENTIANEEFLSSFIAQEKKKAKPLGRQNVDKERVKSKNPFRKSGADFEDNEEHDIVSVPSAITYSEEDMQEEPVQEVRFQVNLDKKMTTSSTGRKRQSDSAKVSSLPKITRTIGAVQEDTVSSSSKVNVTFNGKCWLDSFGAKKDQKISCSSFTSSTSDKQKNKPEVRARLGKKNVKNRLGL